jgi:hypothetical protein
MNPLSRRSFRMRLERVIGSVVVMVMVGATVSSALAAELPAGAGNNRSLSPSYVSQCEAELALAASNKQQAMPPYAGLMSVRSDTGRYDLWRPADWSVSGVDAATLVVAPGGQDQRAHFFIQATDTGHELTFDDLMGRITWFNDMLQFLPNSEILWQAHWIDGDVTGFEARYTSRDDEDGAASASWVRLLYVGARQYLLVAEAPSTADFDSLQPEFLAMMATFRLDDQVAQTPVDLCIA